jgi:ribosomal protein S12 methylthiotransferase
MPVQHSNTRLLELMNRRYSGEFLRGLITELHSEIPELVLRTSLILGFPSETEAEFHELMGFIEEYPFAHLGCFAYSEERETRSARIEPKIESDEITRRIDAVMAKQAELVGHRNKALIGKKLELVYEGNRIGRSYREAPEVDGRLLIADPKALVPGDMAIATVIGVADLDLTVVV